MCASIAVLSAVPLPAARAQSPMLTPARSDSIITTRMTGTLGVLPKERLDDLRTWLKAIAADEVSSIVARSTPAP